MIYSEGSGYAELLHNLPSDTAHIGKWFKQNRLTVNFEKSGSMIIGTSLRLGSVPDIDINIYDSVLPNLLKYDYLGVTVKSTLSRDLHIHKVCSKLSQKVLLLSRLQSSVPNEMLKIVYQTCVQPTVDYCITVWGYAPATLIRKVQSFQNRAARIITGIRDWKYTRFDFSEAARVDGCYEKARLFYGHAYA